MQFSLTEIWQCCEHGCNFPLIGQCSSGYLAYSSGMVGLISLALMMWNKFDLMKHGAMGSNIGLVHHKLGEFPARRDGSYPLEVKWEDTVKD